MEHIFKEFKIILEIKIFEKGCSYKIKEINLKN